MFDDNELDEPKILNGVILNTTGRISGEWTKSSFINFYFAKIYIVRPT